MLEIGTALSPEGRDELLESHKRASADAPQVFREREETEWRTQQATFDRRRGGCDDARPPAGSLVPVQQ